MKRLERIEEALIAGSLAAMALLAFAQLVARVTFHVRLPWTADLVQALFAWLIFLGMPYGVRVGSHIGMAALVRMMGPAGARITGIVAASLCTIYAAILAVGAWRSLAAATGGSRVALVLGFALLAFRFAEVIVRIARGAEARVHA